MTLRDLRDTLLDTANPDKVLRLADQYLTHAQQVGAEFVLPKKHEFVKPILDHFLGDLNGWVRFVKNVRDHLDRSSTERQAVTDFFRSLNVRLIQQQRRDRLSAAVEMAIRKRMIDDSPESKTRYAKRCTQVWKTRRDNLLKVLRGQTQVGRLSTEERESVLAEFWRDVDNEIANGELPKP